MKKTFLASAFSLIIFFSLGASFVAAQEPDEFANTPDSTSNMPDSTSNPVKITIDNPFKKGVGDTLFDLAQAIVNNIILPIGGVVAVVAFIYSGFKYVMARGNENEIKEAHRALLYTAIGTALLLGAWVFANV